MLFLAKTADNMLTTSKTILVQRNRPVLASLAVIASQIIFYKLIDSICGPFFICGLGKEDFTSLSPELIDKYTKMFEKEMLLPVKAKKQNKQKER